MMKPLSKSLEQNRGAFPRLDCSSEPTSSVGYAHEEAEKARPKILVITRNLPPLVGGMERLNWHMIEELAKRAEVRVIGPEGAAAIAPVGVVQLREAPLKPLPGFLLAAQWRAWREARAWRPHIVLAGSGLTAPISWLTAKSCGARAAVYVHGLDLAVKQSVYRALWLPAIRRMDNVIANSHATEKLAIDAGVDLARITIVPPGVELPQGELDPEAITRFRAEHQLGQRPVLLSVGRLTRRKGLREFVANVLPQIVAARSDVMLLVVGDAPTQSLHAESQTPESIQAAADSKGIGNHIKFLGVITDRDRLATVYQSADVHVFPVQHIPNDPEGFGMVAIEAAAQGLPTVAYATGGIVDAVAEGKSGYLVAPGDDRAFVGAVIQLLERSLPAAVLRFHAEGFSWKHFGNAVWSRIGDALSTYE
ncbi:glycosyl transferase group 1 [Nitrosococcus halophilus Nc 4]|uniref:Glycosyl transferase group 1 n=1 Tax=Nitrosococcus halophilus (strain Nc4) TaxID=472759 RepID=D5BWR4_NITHN|nr:glycosyltransferase family 4 protein [Nitrosococcus halophilus]ADE13795.1 glycosyl transferase group 1 [Nitrosococcus halophilus Nc 4]